MLFGIYGSLLIITQYLQNVRGYSAEVAGLLLLSMTVPTVIAAPTAGRIVGRVGARLPTLCGVGAIAIGLAILAVTTGQTIVFTLVGLAFVGVAGGLAVAPATSIAMGSIDPERSGMASGILSVQRALGSTAGFAIMGSILAATVAATLPSDFGHTLTNAAERNTAVQAVVKSAEPNGFVSLVGPSQPLPISVSQEQALLAEADSAFVAGIRLSMIPALMLVLAAFSVGFRVFPHGHRATEESETEEAEELDRG
ncbi:MAG: MFS transporter [Actinobacteria bacterium]|nr:MFS transporter [Actinomycetota bacterium]